MSKYSVSVIFGACKSVVVEAGSAQEAADLAYDEAVCASLCHWCSGEIEIADAVRAIVYDENGDEVFDDGPERFATHSISDSAGMAIECISNLESQRDELSKLLLEAQRYVRYRLEYTECDARIVMGLVADIDAAIAKAKGGAA